MRGYRSAMAASPVKVGDMALDMAFKICTRNLYNAFNAVHLQIRHTAALRADKMIMGRGIGIKVIYTVTYAQAVDFANIR